MAVTSTSTSTSTSEQKGLLEPPLTISTTYSTFNSIAVYVVQGTSTSTVLSSTTSILVLQVELYSLVESVLL